MQTRKHSPRTGQENGPVKGGHTGDREGTIGRAGGNNDSRACAEEQGDPPLSRGADSSAEPSPGTGRTCGGDCQQGSSVRQTHRDGGILLGLADLVDSSQVFEVDERPVEGDNRSSCPSRGPPRRMTDSGLPGSPTAGIYEAVGEVELVPSAQATAGPNQAAGTSRQHESGRALDREKTPKSERVRSPPIQRESTECSARSGQVQSPMPE